MPLAVRLFGVDVSVLGAPSHSQLRTVAQGPDAARTRYQHGGKSLTASPPKCYVNHVRARLGSGQNAYERAVHALRSGAAFELRWVRMWRRHTTQWMTGDTLVIAARVLPGLWTLNVNRVVLVRENANMMHVAWATTGRHVLQGEESVVVRKLNEHVEFELRSFSKPNCLAAMLTAPFIRALQRRFKTDVYHRLKCIAQQTL